MLAQATALLILGLAGCTAGGAVGVSEGPALPLTAATGVDPLVKDFVEVCSQAIKDQDAAGKEAERRGYTKEDAQSGDQEIAQGRSYTRTPSSELSPGYSGPTIQMFSVAYPHVESITCQASWLGGPGNPPDLAEIGRTASIEGRATQAKTDTGVSKESARGAWSFIGPGGDPVTISGFAVTDRLVQMTMSTQHRVTTKH